MSLPLPASIWRTPGDFSFAFKECFLWRKFPQNVCLWELRSPAGVQHFSPVCGGELAKMEPSLTSCPEMAWGWSASNKPAQAAPGGGRGQLGAAQQGMPA